VLSLNGSIATLRLNDKLSTAMGARDQQPFRQVQFQVLTVIDGAPKIGLAAFQFSGQVDIDRLLTQWASVRFKHNNRAPGTVHL
jgi:hypothetical protein